MRRNT